MIAKPSPETPLSALALAFLAEKAGFPKGAFNVMTTTLANTPALSEALCKHPTVKKVSFTGSVRDKVFLCYNHDNSKTNSLASDSRWENPLRSLCRIAKETHA